MKPPTSGVFFPFGVAIEILVIDDCALIFHFDDDADQVTDE